ncbi:Thyroid receptor-interacting protein 11 [Anthophora quadrimaculata]
MICLLQKNSNQDDDLPKNRNSKNQNQVSQLQEQLAQATMRIHDLEAELKRVRKVSNASLKDELTDGYQTAELMSAKQNMVNRIIKMEEKSHETERNAIHMQSDETMLIDDFRTVLSKLSSIEKLDLVRGALKALETENEKHTEANKYENSDFNEKFKRPSAIDHKSIALKPNLDVNTENHKQHDGFIEASSNRESGLCKKVKELEEENKRLFASIEMLDQQHEESIEKLLSLKEELEKKHQCLQNAYEQLYVDYNQAQDKVVELEGKFTESNTRIQTETVSCSVQTANLESVQDEHVQTEDPEVPEDRNDANVVDELTRKVKDILENSIVETESDESIFEAVARQFVDMKRKKDALEKEMTELTNELQEIAKVKENLQIECNMEQAIVDSLLQEIQDLKLNLSSIPEANEERVASLESETESLHDEVKRLETENAALRKENALLQGVDLNETRLEIQGQPGVTPQSKKPTRLEDIPEDIEDTDNNTVENLNRRLHASLDENNELRKKLDLLENTEKETQEQLRMSLERCKGLDENIEFIEELKLDLENVRRELKTSTSNAKQLENSLTLLQDTKNEMQKENEELSLKNEQLESEISKWLESNVETNDNDALKELQEQLKELQEQLNAATREKHFLEHDTFNMRKELDEALSQIDLKESYIAKLSQENKNLTKEKSSLLEQLTAIQDESNDKIDLINMEKSLLEQEQTELKEKVANNEKEMNEIKTQFSESEERYTKLVDEFLSLNEKVEELQLENENLQNEIKKHNELKCDLEISKLTEKLNSMQNDHVQLSNEVEQLRTKEKEFVKLQENFASVTEEARTLRNEYETVQDNCKKLERDVIFLQTEKKQLLSRLNESDCDNEKQRILVLLEQKTRENDALKVDSSKLQAEIDQLRRKLQDTIDNKTESDGMAKETMQNMFLLVKEKDETIGDLNKTLKVAKDDTKVLEHFATIKNERDELIKLVTIKHNESLQYHAEIQKLSRLLKEQTSEIQSLLLEKDADGCELKEKNTQLLRTEKELQAVHQQLKKIEESRSKEMCGIIEHSTQMSEISMLKEKCNALEAALIQEQSNNRMLQNQLNESQSKETNAAKELERLRTHLVEIESSYTEEALIAEETRKELEAKLQQAEEKMKSNSTAYTSANIRSNQQVETLQQQMALIVQQRDDIQNKLSAAEDKILSQTASLSNLQIVLEQFQRDKEKDIIAATERIHSKLTESYKRQEELTIDVINLKEQLTEAKECLQAASRLSEQLDKKTERIEQLSQEVDRLTNLVDTADRRIEEAKQTGEEKVDKTLVKNLLLGFLSSSAADKSSVLRVLSTVLDFSETEKDKAGLNSVAVQNSWFSRLSGGSTVPNKDQEASLSAAFVRFLENESKPKPQLPALPIQTSSLQRPGHSRQHSTSSTQSTLLLSNVNLPTFPDFVPPRNTGSILKEVLRDS